MRETEATTLAYAAGLLDGEGSIVIGVGKRKQRVSPDHWLQVGITNTDRELMDWLLREFGGHISDNSKSPSRSNRRPCWAWRVMSNQAKDFLTALLPYLRVKRPQALLAIEFQSLRNGPTSRQPTPEMLAERDSFKLRITTLNRRMVAN